MTKKKSDKNTKESEKNDENVTKPKRNKWERWFIFRMCLLFVPVQNITSFSASGATRQKHFWWWFTVSFSVPPLFLLILVKPKHVSDIVLKSFAGAQSCKLECTASVMENTAGGVLWWCIFSQFSNSCEMLNVSGAVGEHGRNMASDMRIKLRNFLFLSDKHWATVWLNPILFSGGDIVAGTAHFSSIHIRYIIKYSTRGLRLHH